MPAKQACPNKHAKHLSKGIRAQGLLGRLVGALLMQAHIPSSTTGKLEEVAQLPNPLTNF